MHAYARAALAAAAFSIAFAVAAAETSNAITVTGKQLQSLGVEIQPLAAGSVGTPRKLPAQVVIPNAQIRVVAASLAGLVQTMAVAPNDPVKKGQLLARLQSPMLVEAQRDYLQAATQAQLAQTGFARDEQLFKEGIIAEGRLQASRASQLQAAAALSERRQALRLYGMSDAAISGLSSGKGMSSTLDIVSPLSGVVLEQMAAAGQRVEAAAPLYKVAQLTPLWLEMQATAAAAGGIAPGAAVTVPGGAGKVISVGRHVDAASQTVMIRAEITQGTENLRAGQYLEAQVAGSAGVGQQWQVPSAALVRHQGKTYVLVQSPSGFVATAVKVLGEGATASTISGELRGDERVAVKGIAALKAIWTGVGEGE
jgi:RND family efflux transporter MFP subunit